MRVRTLVRRFLIAPIFVTGLVVSTLAIFSVMACITIGVWVESALRQVGLRNYHRWLAFSLGLILYIGFGIIGSALAGGAVLGWVGVFIGPLISLLIVALAGRW